MSLSAGPDIFESGLVLHLDAGNRKSYPETGIMWYDLSGNGNHATMFGSVPYVNDIVNCFDFATVTGSFANVASLGFLFSNNMVPRSGNFTFSCWVKNPNSVSSQIALFSNTGNIDGYRFGVSAVNAYYLIGGPNYSFYSESAINFTSPLSTSSWHNVVMVYDRVNSSILLYRNGVLQGSSSISLTQETITSDNPPGIVRAPCCQLYTGKLAGFSVYDKGLNAQEISQNFVALRGRFGL